MLEDIHYVATPEESREIWTSYRGASTGRLLKLTVV